MEPRQHPPDWSCPSCDYLNFGKRQRCHRCSTSIPDSFRPEGGLVKEETREGDWICASCQHMNFARRACCRDCGTLKESLNGASTCNYPPDWSCLGCRFSNFGRNRSCLQCGAARREPKTSSLSGGGKAQRQGDWYCSCGFLVYAQRPSCGSCGSAREKPSYMSSQRDSHRGRDSHRDARRDSHQIDSYTNRSPIQGKADFVRGDWSCTCGEYVFARADSCRRCGASKPTPNPAQVQHIGFDRYVPGSRPQHQQANSRDSSREGDWPCPECSYSNFSYRNECFKCKTLKRASSEEY